VGDAAVIVPARDEAGRVAATVAAAAGIDGVDLVVVVDDASQDATAAEAAAAGAVVVERDGARPGKAGAILTGARAVEERDRAEGRPPRLLLLLDADLGDSARHGTALLAAVRGGADLAVARFVPTSGGGGGRGRVIRLSRQVSRRHGGVVLEQPLNGQRAMSRATFDALLPLAPGFGLETGMNVRAGQLGLRVEAVDVPMTHRVTGHSRADQLHRARQYAHVLRVALALRVRGLTGGAP
jgi:glycosyltransferase involved in cell wall biosynthesis